MKKYSLTTLIVVAILSYLFGMTYPIYTNYVKANEVEYQYQMQINELNSKIDQIIGAN